MTRNQLIKKHPELFLEIIKEGIEITLHGYTDISSIKDVEKANENIKERIEYWEKLEKGQIEELI